MLKFTAKFLYFSYERATEIDVPVLIIHGEMDESIPVSHSVELEKQFKRSMPPYYVEKANHVTIFSGKYLTVFLRIQHFLRKDTDKLHKQEDTPISATASVSQGS